MLCENLRGEQPAYQIPVELVQLRRRIQLQRQEVGLADPFHGAQPFRDAIGAVAVRERMADHMGIGIVRHA
ncbi:MAG: hypothetical protein UZ03_NOB001000609, partial [Nitrospira sp. OLB3]